jgi:DNA gyrase subunit A
MVLDSSRVREVRIEEEMRTAYLDYAMSVIVSRALPDVRDGLKPVQRRILYAMHEMGLRPNSAFKKCAAIVGEVLGKYHPHGDSPVYAALVRMAQDFSLRHLLITGQGNFGSVDDDPPAAMRYTEARLAPIAEQMLGDLDRATVDYVDNYDGSQQEPTVLPTLLPNLLLNGAGGIAVGMATNIPPHNLGELCAAIVHLVDHPDATVDDLMEHVKAPDFPTAGIIMGREGIIQAYHTGHGRVMVRARATVEEMDRGDRRRILVSELPYQVNKAALVEKIATLVKDKKLDGISDIRDESGRDGMRVVIELTRGMNPDQVLSNLFKHTSMQSAFHVNMLALVDGQPRTLTLRSALTHFIEFRRLVIQRRAEYDLGRARSRAHILEGMRIALQNLDAVIQLIRDSNDVESARSGLMAQFALTETQAQAILDMQLRRLAALERQRIEDEWTELQVRIADLEGLLGDPTRVLAVVKEETIKLGEDFTDSRRSELWDQEATNFSMEELTPHADVVVTLSDRGYLKRLPIEAYRLQRRGGKGVRGQQTREGDAVRQLVVADTHDWLFFFTSSGRVYRERVFFIGQDSTRQTRGTPVQNLINIDASELVTAVVAIKPDEIASAAERFIVMATLKGEVKRMNLGQFANIRSNGLAAMDLEKGDSLLTARLADSDMTVIMVSREGKGAQFALEDVRVRQTRTAGGVRGIRLVGDDYVVGMDVAKNTDQLLLLTERGYGKRTAVNMFRTTGRGAQGVIALRITDKTGPMAAAVVVGPDVEEVMVGSAKAMVFRTRIKEIRTLGRMTHGVMVMTKLQEGDQVISMSAFKEGALEDEPDLPVLSAPKAEKRTTGRKARGNKAKSGNGATGASQPSQLTLGIDEASPGDDADDEDFDDEELEENED